MSDLDAPGPLTLPPPIRDPNEPWRLSWGCGPVVREPWHHSDIRWWPGMEVDADPDLTTWDHVGPITGPRNEGLPWTDLTFAGIVANHVLQALPWPDLVPALMELRRVLTHDGVLRVLVPSLLGAVGALVRREADHFQVADAHESSLDGKFCMYVSQAGATRSVFTVAWLDELLRRAGFSEVVPVSYGTTLLGPPWIIELDSRQDESIIFEAKR